MVTVFYLFVSSLSLVATRSYHHHELCGHVNYTVAEHQLQGRLLIYYLSEYMDETSFTMESAYKLNVSACLCSYGCMCVCILFIPPIQECLPKYKIYKIAPKLKI